MNDSRPHLTPSTLREIVHGRQSASSSVAPTKPAAGGDAGHAVAATAGAATAATFQIFGVDWYWVAVPVAIIALVALGLWGWNKYQAWKETTDADKEREAERAATAEASRAAAQREVDAAKAASEAGARQQATVERARTVSVAPTATPAVDPMDATSTAGHAVARLRARRHAAKTAAK